MRSFICRPFREVPDLPVDFPDLPDLPDLPEDGPLRLFGNLGIFVLL